MRPYTLQKLFNVAPWANTEHLIDKQGEKFWIYWNSRDSFGPELHVRYRGRPVGGVETMWTDSNDGGLELTDIYILESSKHLRRRGLGKRMFWRFVEQAKKEGALYIKGIVNPHDGEDLDYVLEWYKRQGFDVRGRKIFMNLALMQ